ncbi:unnamed protein product [Protopolystoma xenopodis]|uniref:Uncharacterized protein n=1 Tax=Protopolystoma xenopodis TaxID=117903 RepID=A0A3S5CGL4_9PLAT|nr:unnamed protein product [Protopolystoma xenopodis]
MPDNRPTRWAAEVLSCALGWRDCGLLHMQSEAEALRNGVNNAQCLRSCLTDYHTRPSPCRLRFHHRYRVLTSLTVAGLFMFHSLTLVASGSLTTANACDRFQCGRRGSETGCVQASR